MKLKINLVDGNSAVITVPDSYTTDQIETAVRKVHDDYSANAMMPNYTKSLEQKADMASSPIMKQGADRVHLSDIYAMERPKVSLNPMGEEVPYEEPVKPTVKIGTKEAKKNRTLLQKMYPETSENNGWNAEGTRVLPIAPTLRDIYSLPVRAVSTGIEYAQGLSNRALGTNFEVDPDLGRTSAESLEQGKTGEGILTSPLVVPNAIVGVSTGGASIPFQVGAGAITGVASGAAMDDDYGGDDVAVDVALSSLPYLGSILNKLPRNASYKAIKGALSKAGITGNDAEEIITVIKSGGYKEADRLAGEFMQSGKQLMTSDIDMGSNILSTDDMELIIYNIKATAGKNPPPNYPKRSLKEVRIDIGRLEEAKKDIDLMNELLENGAIDQKEYGVKITELFDEYGNIPEFTQMLQANLSKSEAAYMGNLRDVLTKNNNADALDIAGKLGDVEYTPSTIDKGYELFKKGRALKNVQQPTTSPLTGLGIGDISLGALRKLGQKTLTQPSPLVANLEEGTMQLLTPTLSSTGTTLYKDQKLSDLYK